MPVKRSSMGGYIPLIPQRIYATAGHTLREYVAVKHFVLSINHRVIIINNRTKVKIKNQSWRLPRIQDRF